MLKHELLQFLLEATCWTTSCFQFKIVRNDTDYSYSAPYNYVFELHGIWCVKHDRIMTMGVKYVGNLQRDNSGSYKHIEREKIRKPAWITGI